jgi:hypothetical protein
MNRSVSGNSAVYLWKLDCDRSRRTRHWPAGTRIFTAEEALASLTGTAPTDLGPMAEKVAAFLPASGLVETEPRLDGLFDPSFTEDHIDRLDG